MGGLRDHRLPADTFSGKRLMKSDNQRRQPRQPKAVVKGYHYQHALPGNLHDKPKGKPKQPFPSSRG